MSKASKSFKVGDEVQAMKLGREGIEVKVPVKGKLVSQSKRFSFIKIGPNKSVVVLTKNLMEVE